MSATQVGGLYESCSGIEIYFFFTIAKLIKFHKTYTKFKKKKYMMGPHAIRRRHKDELML